MGEFQHLGQDLSTMSLVQPDHSPDRRFPLPGSVCDMYGERVGREGSKPIQRTTPRQACGGWLWRCLEETKADVGGIACAISFCLHWDSTVVKY